MSTTEIEPRGLAPVVPGYIAIQYDEDGATPIGIDLSYRCPECGDIHFTDDYGRTRTPLECSTPGVALDVRPPRQGEARPPDPDDPPTQAEMDAWRAELDAEWAEIQRKRDNLPTEAELDAFRASGQDSVFWETLATLQAAGNPISFYELSIMEMAELTRYEEMVGAARKIKAEAQKPQPDPEPFVLPGGTTCQEAAAAFLRHHRHKNTNTLIRHGGQYYTWVGKYYRPDSDEDIKARLYRFLESSGPDWCHPVTISKTMEYLYLMANLPAYRVPPCWIDGVERSNVVAFRNGLLHLATRELYDHTAAYFGLAALPFDYWPHAPEPVEWLRFLDSIWGSDEQSKTLLQEWIGCTIAGETRFQKILLMVGPSRSGKGTIGAVMRELVGTENACGPTLAALASHFGLQGLIGKLAAVVADARLSTKVDGTALAERLLTVSANDPISVPRKNMTDWDGRLGVLLTVLTNELPKLHDASGALANRFLVLRMTESFLGREDTGLLDRLRRELPSILMWALRGLDRVIGRGRFVEPDSSVNLKMQMADLLSQVSAFVRTKCDVGPAHSVRREDLYLAWCEYCATNGWQSSSTSSTFGQQLRAAVPSISDYYPVDSNSGKQVHSYSGIGLREPVVRKNVLVPI